MVENPTWEFMTPVSSGLKDHYAEMGGNGTMVYMYLLQSAMQKGPRKGTTRITIRDLADALDISHGAAHNAIKKLSPKYVRYKAAKNQHDMTIFEIVRFKTMADFMRLANNGAVHVDGQQVDSRWTAGGQQVDSRWTAGGQQVDSTPQNTGNDSSLQKGYNEGCNNEGCNDGKESIEPSVDDAPPPSDIRRQHQIDKGLKPDGQYEDDITGAIMYLNQKTKSKYKTTAQRYRSLLKKIFMRGRTPQDVKDVIDNKIDQWLTDKKMFSMLRPETLFGENFETYVAEPKKTNKTMSQIEMTLKQFSGDNPDQAKEVNANVVS